MILYHGSNTEKIKVLEPRQADHDRPYVYMTTLEVVSAFYLCNAVERPYNYFIDCERKGILKIGRFEDKSDKELQGRYNMIYEYIKEKNMIAVPDCSYAKFVRAEFPQVWERYIND